MYSYGSSTRVGVGKRGHGGREYRPPRKRRDPNATPPPLKECNCLVEIHLEEYARPEPLGRQHSSFGGRRAMEQCEKVMRSDYQVHFMIPGKKQQGPVNMVAKTYREAIPALTCLLAQHLTIVEESTRIIRGRVHRNVKDHGDQVLDGSFFVQRRRSAENGDTHSQSLPFWLFQSPEWSVLACSLLSNNGSDHNDTSNDVQNASQNQQLASNDSATAEEDVVRHQVEERAVVLQTCLDNIIFRLGKEAIGQLDIFFDPHLEYSFAVGNPGQAETLHQEIATAFQQPSPSECEQ